MRVAVQWVYAEKILSLLAADVKFLLVPPQQAEPQKVKTLIDLLRSKHGKRHGV